MEDSPEEGDTVEGLLLPQHVLGSHSTVIVSNLPVSDISSVSNEWEGESYNVSTSIHILTRLHGLWKRRVEVESMNGEKSGGGVDE